MKFHDACQLASPAARVRTCGTRTVLLLLLRTCLAGQDRGRGQQRNAVGAGLDAAAALSPTSGRGVLLREPLQHAQVLLQPLATCRVAVA
eukprot:scaffold2802_cov188-Prasinococcus_capsulatus_cf.AAC.1